MSELFSPGHPSRLQLSALCTMFAVMQTIIGFGLLQFIREIGGHKTIGIIAPWRLSLHVRLTSRRPPYSYKMPGGDANTIWQATHTSAWDHIPTFFSLHAFIRSMVSPHMCSKTLHGVFARNSYRSCPSSRLVHG